MFFQQMWWGTLTVTLTVAFHAAVLLRPAMLLTTLDKKPEKRHRLIKALTLLIAAILVIRRAQQTTNLHLEKNNE